MKIFMIHTLQLMQETQPKRVQNIVDNSQVVERDNKPPYFILNNNNK